MTVWTHPITVAIITGIVAGLGSAVLTTRLQHHFWKLQREDERRFWKLQRADELRLEAIKEYNRLTTAYVAACLAQTNPGRSVEEWLRDINTAGATIRVLFSADAYQPTRAVDAMIKPYAWWQQQPDRKRKQLGDEFSDVCHAALVALYREVIK
jgi:hypothetical protein